ncbi:MAG: class I SAM-dependent methyltransferase [Planctomycetes bacterium]|nr:class I SAM-dependent methyltransferase [Planctomycetota bacterium]
MKRRLLNGMAKILGKARLLRLVEAGNHLLRGLVSWTHSLQGEIAYGVQPSIEWFDHNIDLHSQWHRTRGPQWIERGCFNLLAIKPGARVLELCCGDGFNSYHFYSLRAGSILAVDADPEALTHARRRHAVSNIEHRHCDITAGLPEGKFDNIIWDAAIEHFSEKEIQKIMPEIHARLDESGIFSGYTIVRRKDGNKSLGKHQYEFLSKEDLLRFFTPHFRNARVFETIYPGRHNLYFWASDGMLPFDENWPEQAIAELVSQAIGEDINS